MILKSFLTFLPSLIAGFIILQLVWKSNDASAIGLKISLGVGLGLGISSCLYFVRLLLLPGQGGFLFIQILFLVVTIIVLFAQRQFALGISLKSFSFSWPGLLFGCAFIIVAGITIYYLVTFARMTPHGDYDAQAIWNLRARFMYRAGDAWDHAFSPLINRNFHMDYPLLIPLSVLGGWTTLGAEVLRVPSLLSMLFLSAMAGVVYFMTSYLRSSLQGAIAVILLLATPSLLLFSTFQTADVPLTYFFLASACLLVLAHKENHRGLLFLSGMMAGLSAWTKNEGIPFLVIVILYTIMMIRREGMQKQIYSLVAGLAFPLFILVLFKVSISVNNDLFTDNNLSEIIAKLFSPARYAQVFTYLTSELIHLGGWPISIIVVLLVYALIMGVREGNSPAERALWILPLSQLVVYMFIYIITPHELQWHLNYSMSRLLIHLFPMALCSFFLLVNIPDSVLNKLQ